MRRRHPSNSTVTSCCLSLCNVMLHRHCSQVESVVNFCQFVSRNCVHRHTSWQSFLHGWLTHRGSVIVQTNHGRVPLFFPLTSEKCQEQIFCIKKKHFVSKKNCCIHQKTFVSKKLYPKQRLLVFCIPKDFCTHKNASHHWAPMFLGVSPSPASADANLAKVKTLHTNSLVDTWVPPTVSPFGPAAPPVPTERLFFLSVTNPVVNSYPMSGAPSFRLARFAEKSLTVNEMMAAGRFEPEKNERRFFLRLQSSGAVPQHRSTPVPLLLRDNHSSTGTSIPSPQVSVLAGRSQSEASVLRGLVHP